MTEKEILKFLEEKKIALNKKIEKVIKEWRENLKKQEEN